MKMITDLCVYENAGEKSINLTAEDLLEEIKGFAKLKNLAFWDDEGREKPDRCLIVECLCGDVISGLCIHKKNIEKAVMEWCLELVNRWREIPQEDVDTPDAHTHLRIEISDNKMCGGLVVRVFDDMDLEDELNVINMKEGAE